VNSVTTPAATARDVQLPVVQAQVEVGDQRRDGAERLERRRQEISFDGLGGYLDDLADRPPTT
jgi:hypothetical protein